MKDDWRPHSHGIVWRRVVILAVAILAIWLVAKAMADEPPTCAQAAVMRKALAAVGEEPVLRALASTGQMFEVWATPNGSSWTATATNPRGVLCILGMGRNAQELKHLSESGTPAAWVMAEESSTLFVRACSEGKCKTIRIEVPACTAGGQAALAKWLEQHPGDKVVTFSCFEGDPA